ncbi:MAG: sialidase family protein [Kiritimatiellaeota bacterium]|nr:sialidase family protein [Kiritimatiellota bacterium]
MDIQKKLDAEHGIVCRLPNERFGYFGWPSVARMDDGTLVVASSGLRSEHICPWGKTVLNLSTDDGRTWSAPRVINDSPLDDRDAGIVNLGGDRLLVSWFTSDTRQYLKQEWVRKWLGAAEVESWHTKLATVTDAIAERHIGSWIMRSEHRGTTWSPPIRVPVSTPHGPIRMHSGELLYLGKPFGTWDDMVKANITAARSADGGRTWEVLGQVPIYPGTDPANYHEPHVIELSDGHLLGMVRIEDHSGKTLKNACIPSFSLMQTESDDGGRTWTTVKPLGFHGSPPHLMRHSSGVLILTYGYRQAPYGQRVAFSRDDGATWDHDWIIRDDGPDSDLGYPSTVELADGNLFSVCYQKVPGDKKCSLLWSRWQLPETR